MAILAHYLLMWVLVFIIVCMAVTTPLLIAGKTSTETAFLAPMLILCFVYTPFSWFAFDGLLGCTPYLSILFSTLIALTYYRRIQTALLSLYVALMMGLSIYWLAARPGIWKTHQIINILIAYVITAALTVCIAESVKRKNLEINKRVTELSMRDDLTGLFNRRASTQILPKKDRKNLRGRKRRVCGRDDGHQPVQEHQRPLRTSFWRFRAEKPRILYPEKHTLYGLLLSPGRGRISACAAQYG